MLHAHVFGGDHLAVEHHLLRAVLVVVALDQPQNLLGEAHVVGVVDDGDPLVFGRFDQAVDADGEVLARQVDVARVEERKHSLALQLFEVLVVGQLHLVRKVDHLFEERQVGNALPLGVLDTAVEVDRQHALRTGRDAARSQRVAESVVLDLVAQAAARRQRVGVVAHVGEERMSFGVHLGREVAPLGVHHVAVAGQQRHRLDGEGEHGFEPFGVEPLHEAFLQPRQPLPVGARPVGETELAEERFEVVAVVVGDIPEDGLEVACAGGLVDRVDHLFEAVGDDLVDRAAVAREVDHLVGAPVVVLAELLRDEVVHVHQEFGGGAGAREHRRDDEDHVDEAAAEGFEIGRPRRVAADRGRAAQQPRIHRDRGAVVGQRRLVVLVDEMAVEQFEVTVGDFFAVHLLQPVGQQAAVETDEVLLGQLADERGDVLVLDVGVGVVFRAGGGVLGLAVVHQELQLVAHFAVFGMFLPVDDVGFGHLVVAFGHQRRLDLVLNLFDGRAVRDADASQNLGEHLVGGETPDREEGFGDGRTDLVDRETLAFAVALGDENFGTAHS